MDRTFVDTSSNQTLSGKTLTDVQDIITKGPWVDVRAFGAKGDGVTDDTAAIQTAINSIGSNGTVFFPPKVFKITSTLIISNNRVHLIGSGEYATEILFAPISNSTALLISAGASQISQGSVKNMAFFSNDSTYTKIAIDLRDSDGYELSHLVIGGSVVIGSSSYWSGGTGSVGIIIEGRQAGDINNIYAFADKPLQISKDPNIASISIDHFNFYNLYLGANGNPIVTIDDGVVLSQVIFDGYQAWVLGTYGLYWNDTTSSTISNGLKIKNVRTEQGTLGTAYQFYINHNYALQGLLIENVYGGLDRNGYYFRKVQNWTISNSAYISTTKEALNINTTTYIGKGINNYWQTGATATISGLRLVSSQGMALNTTIASDFLYESTVNVAPFTTSQQIVSTLPTGTTPLSIISTTKVPNLVVEGVGTQATSGTPSGTPVAGGMIFDTSNNKLWAYTGSAWKSVTLA